MECGHRAHILSIGQGNPADRPSSPVSEGLADNDATGELVALPPLPSGLAFMTGIVEAWGMGAVIAARGPAADD